MPYKILQVVDATEVPNWERRPPKWFELVEQVMALEPNQALVIRFDSVKEAKQASNAVRDEANLRARAIVVRTRIVEDKNTGKGTLYLTRTHEVPQER